MYIEINDHVDRILDLWMSSENSLIIMCVSWFMSMYNMYVVC